jgi:hypothetical protein
MSSFLFHLLGQVLLVLWNGVGIMIDELLVLLGFWVCRGRRSLAAHADADRLREEREEARGRALGGLPRCHVIAGRGASPSLACCSTRLRCVQELHCCCVCHGFLSRPLALEDEMESKFTPAL